MMLQDICSSRNIHLTIYATGCIFEYDADHTIGGKPFTEEDDANFDGSFYSLTKGMVEKMLRTYSGVRLTFLLILYSISCLIHRA